MFARIAAVFLVLMLAPTLAPGRAHGQAPVDENEPAARELFRKAEISFNLGKFAEALSDYQAAYEAKPLSGFLFNIAQCYRHMGEYERARFFYRRYLSVDPRTPNRRLVTDLIAEVTRLMDSQSQKSAPPPQREVPAPPVNAPPPRVPAFSPGARAQAAPLVASPGYGDQPTETPGRPVYKRWWFWTSLAVLAAGGATAAVLLMRETPSHGTLPPIDCGPGSNPAGCAPR